MRSHSELAKNEGNAVLSVERETDSVSLEVRNETVFSFINSCFALPQSEFFCQGRRQNTVRN